MAYTLNNGGVYTFPQVKVLRFHQKYECPAITIQSYYRGWKVRRSFRRERAAVVIQSYCRGWKVRRFSVGDRAAIVIQKYFRAMMARRYFTMLRATVKIQSYYRGWKVNNISGRCGYYMYPWKPSQDTELL